MKQLWLDPVLVLVVILRSLSHVLLCDPTDCSPPNFPVLHHLLELAQTRVHWVGDAIQPSHPLLSPFPLALNLSQHQGPFISVLETASQVYCLVMVLFSVALKSTTSCPDLWLFCGEWRSQFWEKTWNCSSCDWKGDWSWKLYRCKLYVRE